MEYKQLDIFEIHLHESNPESEIYLEAGRKEFSNHCRVLFDAFMKGQKLSSITSPVGDFRRRICDMKENGVQLSFETNGRVKIWFFSEENKEVNKKFQ